MGADCACAFPMASKGTANAAAIFALQLTTASAIFALQLAIPAFKRLTKLMVLHFHLFLAAYGLLEIQNILQVIAAMPS